MGKSLMRLTLGALAASACGDKITCAGVGLVRVSPLDTTIAVGAVFLARYQEGGTCSDANHAQFRDVPVIWRTLDTTIVRLDSISGRVTGRAVGDASISVVDRAFIVRVHVRSASLGD